MWIENRRDENFKPTNQAKEKKSAFKTGTGHSFLDHEMHMLKSINICDI